MTPIQAGDQHSVSIASYPRERIPKQAPLSVASLAGHSRSGIPSILDAGEARYVSRGSMAIGLALQHAKIGSDDEVLMPAYHCISMIEPVVWRGARPVCYRIKADTAVDLGDIESRLTSRTRALLVAHYFGFPQDMPRIRSFCDAHGLLLIEDCAHAFFGEFAGTPVGWFGDYAIASAWKFFPVCDGGILVARGKRLADVDLESGGPRFEAKAMVNTLEQAFEYRRLNMARLLLKVPLLLKDLALRQAKRGISPDPPAHTGLSTGFGGWGFDAALIRRRMSFASRSIMDMASKQRITQRRRRNYTRLLAELGGLHGCRPLFASLPDGVVPQVFPLVYEAPELAFPLLKQAGVPIIRFGEYLWEGMDPSTCPVSAEFSRSVFQFPCHQELDDAELEWMISTVKSVTLR
ncbi:MAG: DegT/DnrJ/EryC1/StrS family aminotransferase [Betaproteobacteria bacterium]